MTLVLKDTTGGRAVDVPGYAESGVHIREAAEGLSGLTRILRSTWANRRERVVLDFGYYANVIDIGHGQGLAICTDGVGSKAVVAHAIRKYDTIGIDCVAMNVNDLICVGARPISLVDYIAVNRADLGMLRDIGIGLKIGADRANISVSGGEIAELKDMVKKGSGGIGFDIAGTAVGLIPLDGVLVGADCQPGDVVVGIESSGIHSNGLTMARTVFREELAKRESGMVADFGKSAAEELLEPTHIYVAEAMRILESVEGVRAFAHITSYGFSNLLRVGTKKVGFEITDLPEPQRVFSLIAERGSYTASEMYTVFNMGVGLCVIVRDDGADDIIAIAEQCGKRAQRIGYATDSAGEVVIRDNPLDHKDIWGDRSGFWPN